MENFASAFHESSTARPKPTILIPSFPNIPLTRALTPPTTPPLTPVTPSTPTPTAEFSSSVSVWSPDTPKASNAYRTGNLFEAKTVKEIVAPTHPCELKDELGLLTPPLTPPTIQLPNLPDPFCPIDECVSRSFGICIGAPPMDKLAESSKSLTGRKRKRGEYWEWYSSTSSDDNEANDDQHIIPPQCHAPKIAPCNDCLDDDESLLWGRCDNKRCWSRRYEEYHQKTGSAKCSRKKHSEQRDPEIALICPDCSPEGGLGCEHRWICDFCAFSGSGSLPLVWECPSCLTPICSKCPNVSPSCSCSSSRRQLHNPYCINCMPPASCVLCTELLPICLSDLAPIPIDPFSSSPEAESTYTSEMETKCSSSKCPNCSSSLCSGCRSILKCSMEGCNAEFCQLCPLPGDGLGLVLGSVVCRECQVHLGRSSFLEHPH